MKIAIISDSKKNSGGSLHVTLSAAKSLLFLKFPNLHLDFIVTYKPLYEELKVQYPDKIKLFDESIFVFKISSFLYRNNVFKKIYHKFSLNNYFETFIIKNNYDLIFFITPSPLLLLCNKIKFIYSIWEFAHKEHPSLPEYNENTVANKDKYYNYACNHAFKIVLFNEKSKEDFINYYKVDRSKIETFFFSPFITKVPIKIYSKIETLIKNKKYIFYPAQFWPHKNHNYLLEALKKYNENKDNKIFLVFTGHDKGNLSFIKRKINDLKISKEVMIFNYLDDGEICYLYENCFAVVFPSLVGSQSLPLFESFFFQKPMIYNEKILEPFYKDATLSLNIDDDQSLGLNIEKIINNPKLISNIIKKGSEFYEATLNENTIKAKLYGIFKKYVEYQNLWKNF